RCPLSHPSPSRSRDLRGSCGRSGMAEGRGTVAARVTGHRDPPRLHGDPCHPRSGGSSACRLCLAGRPCHPCAHHRQAGGFKLMTTAVFSAPYLESLNESQREAVEAIEGPVLVLAGAGTGKTRVLTTRLAHILMSGKARPAELLCVTFTNKAAREMKDRISAIIFRPVEGWWLGTFHALAARLLRRHAEVVGLTPNFTILDTDDQIRLLKQLIVAEGIDDKKWPARALLGVIERWKDRGLTPDKVTSDQAEYAEGMALKLYRQYQERLASLNACDFGDLLLHNLTIF